MTEPVTITLTTFTILFGSGSIKTLAAIQKNNAHQSGKNIKEKGNLKMQLD